MTALGEFSIGLRSALLVGAIAVMSSRRNAVMELT
jgi:hypothetical protein